MLEEGAAVEGGLQSAMFVDLVAFLCSELKRLNKMQETVAKPAGMYKTRLSVRFLHEWVSTFAAGPATGVDDAESFQLEMRGFLQELSCPHPQLLSPNNPLATYTTRLLLVGQWLPLPDTLCLLNGQC